MPLRRIGVRFDLGGRFDVSVRFAFCGLGLPPEPDRASSGARGGGKRLGLGRLCFCFLRECQCIGRISRLTRILRRFIDAISVDDDARRLKDGTATSLSSSALLK